MKHIIDEIRETEKEIIQWESHLDDLYELAENIDTLSDDSAKKLKGEIKRADAALQILVGHLALLETDLEENEILEKGFYF